MKKIFLPAVFFSFLLTSCTSDEISTNSKGQNEYLIETATIVASAHKDGQSPDNSANPNDAAGKLFIDVYSSAMQQILSKTVHSAVTTTEYAAQSNSGFTAINQNYGGLSDSQVQWVIDNAASTSTVINSTTASAAGKQALTELITLVESLQGQSYASIYAGIVNFEQGINSNTLLSSKDKEKLFIAASVARYECYGNGPGKSWLVIKTHILAGVKGADTGMPLAITLGAAVKIVQE